MKVRKYSLIFLCMLLLLYVGVFGNTEEKMSGGTEKLKENNMKILQDAVIEEKTPVANPVLDKNNTIENTEKDVPEKKVFDYVERYSEKIPENLSFNYKYSKNSSKDMGHFLFVKATTNIREEPNTNSVILKSAVSGDKLKVTGKVKVNSEKGTSEWYEIEVDGKTGYVISSNMIKREFEWDDMMKRVEKTNNFIKTALSESKKIYVLDDYVPLGGGGGTAKDKYGNRENQSEKGYLNSNFTEYINIPDRSIMVITGETDKYVKVKIDVYDGKEYYLKKESRKLLKDSKITDEVNKFIYVDRKSQNEIVIERSKGNTSWNVVTTSFVTTGKDASDSYATPYGVFLIAHSKPVMQYTGADGKTVAGDAKYAVRFSGGGYMHGIPSLFEPKETREQRKAATAKKIGTFPESHKCIRHYDDQIKFIYDWLGNSTPGDKNGFRVPEAPTIMIVK